MADKKYKDKFYSKTKKVGECLEWQSALQGGNRYGITDYMDKTQLAHRVSYKISKGEIPEGMFVMHSCDNMRCVNPDHLSVGTYRDNIDDMVAKGRSMTGEKNPASKLTEAQVVEIREKYVPRKVSMRKLAKEYGVTTNSVFQIIKRTKWLGV